MRTVSQAASWLRVVRASVSSHCRMLSHSAPPSSFFPIPNTNVKNPKMGMSEHFDTEVIGRKKEEMLSLPARHSHRSGARKSLNFNRDNPTLCICRRTGGMAVSKGRTVCTGRAEGKPRSSRDWKQRGVRNPRPTVTHS